ncbi:hypothetical protein DFQ28_002085 [Apophysomyces sp. BC1034]|nr:hypothetical protein DFQ30_002493 [Apophysomyces sp. BC1015]KAG0179869.1 hypothetical protein DFQ29_001522 [Apophysomyces sp. BC1021]KAG0190416.1 hypothetical protein DFQ28_002085 [Apophysomyces sp. BC1034]
MTDTNRFVVAPPVEFTEDQLQTFQAILDTFIAPLTKEEEDVLQQKLAGPGSIHTPEQIHEFAQLSSTSLQSLEHATLLLNQSVPAERRRELSMLLSLLSTRAGTFALTGHFAEFKNLTQKERETAFLQLQNAYFPKFRLIFKTLAALACYPTYRAQANPLHRGMNYPGTDTVRSHPDYKPESVPERLKMMSLDELHDDLRFDAIVVGSGAGGGVTAAELAKAGKSVLVIDKGTYHHELDFDLNESSAFGNLYEYGGVFTSQDGSISVLAGSAFGGGTTVNWSATLKPQHFVREEWAKQGLTHFISPEFSRDLERVYERLGASTAGIQHNKSNQVLIDGCKALGYHIADIPQNTHGKAHNCGFCFAGCKDGVKNGTMNTWLRDAKNYGARFLDRTKVVRVLVEKGKAVGVECIVQNQHRFKFRADVVVASGGSLHTPGLLLRSGLTNKNIGRNLRLHPVSIAFGHFNENIDTFDGSIMTALSNVAENLDQEGYGAKLEVPSLHPSAYAASIPWRGAAHHKDFMLRYRKCAPILTLVRDKDSVASVRYDENDNFALNFSLSNFDRQSLVTGTEKSLNILVAAGAREVQTSQYGVEPFVFKPDEESRVDNPRYIQWLQRVAKHGIPQEAPGIFCAHQMGSCRMGISPKVSVTKPTGETWEVKNLYVADASLFPTSTGVNPMVTTEAVSLHVAENINKRSGQTASRL